MLILGIETSCDETAAAVVDGSARVLSSVVASQIRLHANYGGVVPELASREHLKAIVTVVREALHAPGLACGDLSAVAVTQGPGLVGSLLVGLCYAKAICFASGLPLVAVNHLEGHIHAVLLEAAAAGQDLELPALALIASGGHTHLFEVSAGMRYRLAGKTRDDAAGEAYDKVAKLLGFGYPGGPVVDQLAPHGDPSGVRFTPPKMKGNVLDFSFSGMKTAALRWCEARDLSAELQARRQLLSRNPRPSVAEWLAVTPAPTLDLLASFQAAVIEELLSRARRSAEAMDARSIIITGGVASNAALRQSAAGRLSGIPVYFPSRALSTDNAAMIAAAAVPKYQRGEFSPLDVSPHASLPLS